MLFTGLAPALDSTNPPLTVETVIVPSVLLIFVPEPPEGVKT